MCGGFLATAISRATYFSHAVWTFFVLAIRFNVVASPH